MTSRVVKPSPNCAAPDEGFAFRALAERAESQANVSKRTASPPLQTPLIRDLPWDE
jgi:hypothetical protein